VVTDHRIGSVNIMISNKIMSGPGYECGEYA